jgi:3-oxoacyl-[acyl-carrier protein] reductase
MERAAQPPDPLPVPDRLAGKVAIVTGAASGMGLASTRRFLAEGAKVVAVDLDEEALAALAAEAEEPSLLTVAADVTDGAAVESYVAATVDRFDRLDLYFNNAGIPQAATPVEEIDEPTWNRVVDVNLNAIFLAARAIVPLMREQEGGGHLLVTASAAGIRPRPTLSAYSAAKAGAVQLARGLAVELAPEIRVNALCPLAADTPMLAGFGFGTHDQAYETLAATSPLGRLVTADEVAAAAAYLASDEASFITGIALPIDGGRTV